MGLEFRKGKPYYYRKERKNGTVVSTYCGRGDRDVARLWIGIDALDRERRQIDRAVAQQARAEFAELASTRDELTLLLVKAQQAARAALEAAGYHQHKRQWRKKRENKNQVQSGDSE